MTRVFIIPEPHIWDKNFKNRIDYPNEIYSYLADIVQTIKCLDGNKYVIFPGDIFHRGFDTVTGMTKALSLFIELNRITNGNVYSCIGNHELSYTKNNPFWMMAHNCTARFPMLKKMDTYGIFSPGIKIVDQLYVGKLKFIFGHYERTDYQVYDESCDLVLISHNSIIEKSIDDTLRTKYGRDTKTEYIRTTQLQSSSALPISKDLKYVFVGHMHTAYSDFFVEDTIEHVDMRFYLRYLGSLGRTSVLEVDDRDLIRTIPQFVLTDANTYTYEPINIKLKSYNEVINLVALEDSAARTKTVKMLKTISSTNSFGETPADCIRRELDSTPVYLSLFDEIYQNLQVDYMSELLQEAQRLDNT